MADSLFWSLEKHWWRSWTLLILKFVWEINGQVSFHGYIGRQAEDNANGWRPQKGGNPRLPGGCSFNRAIRSRTQRRGTFVSISSGSVLMLSSFTFVLVNVRFQIVVVYSLRGNTILAYTKMNVRVKFLAFPAVTVLANHRNIWERDPLEHPLNFTCPLISWIVVA